MPRAAVTSDAFNAIGDRRRREILVYLLPRARSVGEIAAALRVRQPSVSKHLRILRTVGLVQARRTGRGTLYVTNVEAIEPLSAWTQTFERFLRTPSRGRRGSPRA